MIILEDQPINLNDIHSSSLICVGDIFVYKLSGDSLTSTEYQTI